MVYGWVTSCMIASFTRQGGRMASCRGSAHEYTAWARQPICAWSHDRCYLSHATPAGEGGHRVWHDATRPGRHARLEYVLRCRHPAARALRDHGRKAQGRRSRATRLRDGWRQAAPSAPRWAWPCAAAVHRRRLQGRTAACAGVTLYRQRQRAYTQQASERAIEPSLVPASRGSRGEVFAGKSSFAHTSEGDDQEKSCPEVCLGKKCRFYGCSASMERRRSAEG